MTPTAARAALARALAAHGQDVLLRRGTTDYGPVRARIVEWTPIELANGIAQGESKCIVSAQDVEASGFPLPIKRNDAVMDAGARLNIEKVDSRTNRIGVTVIGYNLGVTG